MKKIISVLVVVVLMASSTAFAVSKNEPLKKLGEGLDNIVYGKLETPDSVNETGSKGSPAFSNCTDKTHDDVGRGITRVVGGIWKILTFWYPTE